MENVSKRELALASNLEPRTLNQVCAIAKDAGLAIMAIYDGDHQVEYKDDKSPLTAADKASHEVIAAGLEMHFPDIPILSEEGANIPYEERKNWKRFWLVDPLDGTKEFIKRNGEFTVNIALIEDGQPVMGVVYVPVQKKLYCGIVGEGAWISEEKQGAGSRPKAKGVNLNHGSSSLSPDNDTSDCSPLASCLGPDFKPISVREANKEEGLTVVMSRSHPSPELEKYLKDIKVAEALPVGSSLKLCVVAEGRADLYPRLGPTMEWDTAAGHAVVLAAGGSVVTTDNELLLYNKENLLNPYFIIRGQL